jgi:hypothetical protein
MILYVKLSDMPFYEERMGMTEVVTAWRECCKNLYGMGCYAEMTKVIIILDGMTIYSKKHLKLHNREKQRINLLKKDFLKLFFWVIAVVSVTSLFLSCFRK